jgi:hypothetical protein
VSAIALLLTEPAPTDNIMSPACASLPAIT